MTVKQGSKNKLLKSNQSNTIWISIFLTLSALTFFNISVYLNSKPKIIYAKNDTTDARIVLWKSFLQAHEDYFQGWIELANLELNKGNMSEAKNAFDKAFAINPNSEQIKDLANLMRLK